MPGTGTLAGEDTLSTVEVDGRIEVLSGFGRDVLRWSAEVVGTPDGVLVNEKGRVRAVAAVALAAGGTVALAGVDRDLRSWDAVSGRPLGRPLVGHHGSVESLAAVEYPGGSVLAVSGDADGFVRTWEIDPSGVPAGATEAEVGIVEAVAATTLPDGTEVALGCDRYDVAVWDLDCPVWTVR
jgi:WD40 repeat protein